jgi:hypothetical protein
MALKPVAVRTDTNGDVVVGITSGQTVGATQGTAAASSGAWPVKVTDGTDDATVVADGTSATGQKGLVALNAKAGTSDPTPSDGNLTYLSVDSANGALRTKVLGTVTTSPSGTQAVSGTVTSNQGTAAASSGAWPVKISDGTDDANVAASNSAAAVKGLETLPAIVSSGAPSLTDGRSAALSLDTSGNLRTSASVTAQAPTTPLREYLTATAIAAAGSTTLNGAEIGAVTKKVRGIAYASTAQCRFEFYTVVGGTESSTPFVVRHTSNGSPEGSWEPPHQDFFTLTGTGGADDNFRVKVFNTDPVATADVYVTLYHAEN